MSFIGGATGGLLGVKLMNGKIKPKLSPFGYLGVAVMVVAWIGFFFAFLYGIMNFNLEYIVMPAVGLWGFGYILRISPYTQSSKDYYITVQSENSLAGFELYYKKKKVNIAYKVDSKGKIAFANNAQKTQCISYADGSKMKNITKYRIVNYFTKWLMSNHLLSDEVTITFERNV